MNRVTLKAVALVLIGLSLGTGDARADKAQLEEKLKQELSIQLEDVTMAQALEQIGQKAGVKIELSPQAVWKLPEGEQTRLSVALEGRLSESLEKMLNSFFLRYAVGSESLTIYPRPELKHIIGRPTAEEFKLLTNMYTNKVWVSTAGPSFPEGFTGKMLNGMAGEPIAVMPPQSLGMIARIAQNASTKSAGTSDPNAPRGTPVTIASLLEGLAQSSSEHAAWYIQGPEFPRQVPELWIVPKREFWQAQLDQIVDISFDGERGAAVVERLALWADMEVQYPQGPALEGLARRVTLEVQNARLADVFYKVMRLLGVPWHLNLNEGTVELSSPPVAATPVKKTAVPVPSDSPSDDGYVGKISIPMDGGRYFLEFMLRESDLTEELRRLRQEKVREIIEQLSKAAKEQTQ